MASCLLYNNTKAFKRQEKSGEFVCIAVKPFPSPSALADNTSVRSSCLAHYHSQYRAPHRQPFFLLLLKILRFRFAALMVADFVCSSEKLKFFPNDTLLYLSFCSSCYKTNPLQGVSGDVPLNRNPQGELCPLYVHHFATQSGLRPPPYLGR